MLVITSNHGGQFSYTMKQSHLKHWELFWGEEKSCELVSCQGQPLTHEGTWAVFHVCSVQHIQHMAAVDTEPPPPFFSFFGVTFQFSFPISYPFIWVYLLRYPNPAKQEKGDGYC